MEESSIRVLLFRALLEKEVKKVKALKREQTNQPPAFPASVQAL
jgi:hypothetical protein